MKSYGMWIAMLALPWSGHAVEPLKLASPSSVAPRFIALDTARDAQVKKQAGMPVASAHKAFALRSDSGQIASGLMRIDRARIGVVPAPRMVSAKDMVPAEGSQLHDSGIKNIPLSAEMGTTAPHAGKDKNQERESEEIVGNTEAYDPVLSLFDSADHAQLSSFREAMRRGRASASITGLVQHLIWPVALNTKQSFSSGYGMRADPFKGHQTFHGGIDIAAPTGTPVLATADAQVMQVATDANYGKYVTLQHADGMLSRYGHLSAQHVAEGQRVHGGDVIGAVGSTGRSTGAHLDYRVSKNGVKFDPLAILTIPSNVAMAAARAPASTVVTRAPSKVASNAIARHAMVIEVR